MLSEDYRDNELKYITALGSPAHTYGNLLATAEKWVLDIFPKNLFKTIHVSSEISHRQLIRTPHQFIKKSKPMIIFRPRIAYDEDVFLGKTLMTERMGGMITTKTPGDVELHPFFYDPKSHTNIQFSIVRRVMYLDVILVFDTSIQRMNYMDFISNEIVQGRPFDINTFLEAYLPREIMEMVGNLGGVPVHDEKGSVHDFLTYMNSYSYYPVTYKLAGSTGREEFYRYYKTKIFATLTNLDSGDGESVGQITTNYQINFTLKMEFWAPANTYVFSEKIHEIEKPIPPTDSTLIPIFADVFEYEDLDLAPGWQVYDHATYQLDKPFDTVDISPLLKHSIIEVIRYHQMHGIPMVNFIDIKVRKQGELLPPTKYKVDYNKLEVQFFDKNFAFYTYTIIISIDVLYINEMISEIYKLK